MNMDLNSLEKQPVLIAGQESAVSKIRTFVRASGGVVSSAPMQEAITVEETCKFLEDRDVPIGVLLLCPGQPREEWLDLLLQINKGIYSCPVIVISDDRNFLISCKEMGYVYFLPQGDLNSGMLTDTIFAAQNYFLLMQNSRQLDLMYRESQKRFQDVADQFADWMWEVDVEMNILMSSSRKRPAQGAEIGGKFTSCFLPEEKLRIKDDFAELVRNPRSFRDRDYWSFDAYGTRMCWSVSGVPVLDDDGKVKGFRGVACDVSQEKTSTDKLYYLANNDIVTGIYNRSRFFDEMDRQARQCRRENRPGILVVMDVDRFSYINEVHGHDTGDKLLVHIAQVIQDNMRTGEIVARAAGDEFAIIMPDVPVADIEFRVGRIVEALHDRPLQMENGTLSFNVSVGVVRFPHHGDNADDLFSRVMQVVGWAKERGRNRIAIYSEEKMKSDGMKAENLEWLDFISRCLNDEKERLVLHYQPIVPLDNKGHKLFYEVLVRMLDADGQLVVPTKFIEAAEEYGLVSQIDKIVASRAIEMLQQWHSQGREVCLSVNISAKTFDDEKYLEEISKQIKESKLPPKSIIFEITETSLLRDLAQVQKFIAKMKEVGAGFALDDCGVGYSSFNYIKQLDLDYIKIDGSFIRNLHNSDEDDAFVKALHDVAKRKDIHTVAEMVEHNETVQKLKDMGIEYAQGFYFATPQPELPEEDNTIH